MELTSQGEAKDPAQGEPHHGRSYLIDEGKHSDRVVAGPLVDGEEDIVLFSKVVGHGMPGKHIRARTILEGLFDSFDKLSPNFLSTEPGLNAEKLDKIAGRWTQVLKRKGHGCGRFTGGIVGTCYMA